MSESILVVGATGSVGGELIRQFSAAGRRVRALVRSEAKAAAIADLATPVIGDLSAPATLAPAFRGAERVFVLAPPVPDCETLERNAIDAAVAAGAKRIVYLSNYGASADAADHHFRAHGVNERRIAALAIDWTVLRPVRFMNYMPFVWNSVLQHNLLLETGGDGVMTVMDPADIAAVAFLALTGNGHEGQRYDLTSEDAITAAALAALLSRALGRKLDIFSGDTEALRTKLLECGAPSEYAPIMAAYFDLVRAGFWRVTDTAGRLLGRKPRSYAQWLERNLPAIRASAEHD